MTDSPTALVCDQATRILRHFFTLQRRALNDRHWTAKSWTHEDYEYYIDLLSVLIEDCHALPMIIEHGDADGLYCACRSLWERAEYLCYPAIWDSNTAIYPVWRQFWTAVAEPLGRAPRFGVPFSPPRPPAPASSPPTEPQLEPYMLRRPPRRLNRKVIAAAILFPVAVILLTVFSFAVGNRPTNKSAPLPRDIGTLYAVPPKPQVPYSPQIDETPTAPESQTDQAPSSPPIDTTAAPETR